MNTRHLRACASLLLGASVWAASNVLTSLVSETLPKLTIVFFIYVVGVACLLPLYQQNTFSKDRAKPFLCQVLLLALADAASALAFTFADPNNIAAIFSLNTFAIPIMARIIFKKYMNIFHVVPCTLMTFMGVLCIVQPPFLFSSAPPISWSDAIGYALIFISMLLCSILVSYQQVETFHSETLTFWAFFVIAAVFFLPSLPFLHTLTHNVGSTCILTLTGCLIAFGFVICLRNWKLVDASTAGMIYQTKTPIIFVLSILIGIEKTVNYFKMIGVFLIVAGIVTYQSLQMQKTERKLNFEEEL